MMREIVAVLLMGMFSLGNCHVRLSFPPARKYALDFLDNVRTTGPCGMTFDEAGGHITTLETNAPITVSWHLGYPHMGGIRLELLNATSGEVTSNLTTGGEFQYTNDSTALTQEVTLDASMECEHCVLRLIRQAGEWAADRTDGYLFWSCADVKIVSASAADTCYTGQCLNGGTCENGTCSCLRTYIGDRCEFKNDCVDPSDCNSNGECGDIEATSYPKKICFCNAGKMGRFCSKDSPVSSARKTDTELNAYHHVQLYANPQFDLYWRIMGEDSDEIEVAIRAKTNNWVAVGWRPNSLDATCRNFPTNSGSGSAEPEPETTPEPATTAKPVTTPEPATTAPADTAAARKRRDVEEDFEMNVKLLSRNKRAAEVNVIKDLCNAGNVSGALAYANEQYNADPSGEPEPEGEGTPAPAGEPTPEAEGTGGQLHPMDCQDIVYIAAVGNLHHVLDSYTRDRATPRPDSFYGGSDDLTAAVALREDGILHVVFRRKLASADNADHTIPDENMRVIWARGQDPKMFYHFPLSGLERCKASDYDFYRVNELKYHGTKDTQRGSQILNFHSDPDSTETADEGSLSSPEGCTGTACKYTVSWIYRKETERVQFTVEAEVDMQQWAAIGFSDDKLMPDTDAVVGWMNNANDMPTITDRFITARSATGVALDASQDVTVMSGSYANNRMTFTFTRARNTMDAGNDKTLTECRYFLMAWGGAVTGNDLSRHTAIDVSPAKICIGKDNGAGRIALSWIAILCSFVVSRIAIY